MVMKMRWLLGPFGLAVIIAITMIAWKQFATNPGQASQQLTQAASDSITYRNLETEMNAFQERLETLARDPELQRTKSQDLADLSKRLEEMRRQADRLEFRQSREDRMLDLAAQMSSQSANTSIGMVSFLSTLFVIIVFGVSLGTSLHYKDLKDDLAHLKDDAEKFKSQSTGYVNAVAESVETSRKQMETDLANLKSIASKLGEQADTGGAFLDGLVNVHAEAFSEILSTLPLGRIFPEEEGHRVRLKGKELQGRLLLLHPDMERKKKAVMLLGAVGTKIAKADLRRLQKDSATDKNMALLIESAICKIDQQILGREKRPKLTGDDNGLLISPRG